MKVERSKHVVLVLPPAVERAGDVWARLTPGRRPGVSPPCPETILVTADYEQAALWAQAAPAELRAHAVTGLARSAALLKEGTIGLLAGAAADLAALISRSALKLDQAETLVLAWPESFHEGLDALLAEAPDAQRVVLSWNPTELRDFLERHARRADVIGALPVDADGNALPPVCSARYAVVTRGRVHAAVRDTLDTLRATRPYLWTGGTVSPPADRADVAIATVLPTRDELTALSQIAAPVLLVTAAALPYAHAIADCKPLALPGEQDRAQDRAAALRAEVAARIEAGEVDAEVALLNPLFESYDAASVAGALLAISRKQSVIGHPASAVSGDASAPVPVEPWVKIFVNVGKKDRVGAKDLVGALIKEVGLGKGEIGRIEVRETFSLVEVAPAVAENAVRRLGGVAIRGRRVTAKVDRGR